MKRAWRIGTVVTAAVALGAGAPAVAAAATVAQGANGSKVVLHKGESLTIKLRPADSGSSGYHWRVATKPSASVLRLASNKSTSDGKQQVFTYETRRAGTTSLKLQYVPPSRGARATKTFRLSVAVSAARPASCSQAKSRTVAQNSAVRVFELGSGNTRKLTACRRSTGRRVVLARAFDDGFVSSATYAHVRLSGVFVAWEWTATDMSCKADCPPGYQPTTRSIDVYGIDSRQLRRVDGFAVGDALVLSKFGAVAWASQGVSPNDGTIEIRGSARSGENRLIDSGSIDPKTLAIEITIISWTRDGVERFARLR